MGPLDKYILRDDALTASEEGFQLKFQSHWYRSLPLSCMDVRLSVDGTPIDPAQIRIEANGREYPYSDLPNLDKEWLYILDRATLHVPRSQPLAKGKSYTVEFNLDLYPPYILVGPEAKPLLAGTMVKKTLVCQ